MLKDQEGEARVKPLKTEGQSKGAVIEMGQEPVLAPGVRGVLFDEDDGIWIAMIRAEKPGSGDVSRYLDALPEDRRVVFSNVLSERLSQMLVRRGYVEEVLMVHEPEIEPEPFPLECMVRNAK